MMPEPPPGIIGRAAALALAAAVSLGVARFSYAMLLPPMRSDLGWSYFTAGAMNTVNAAGYLAGALLAPALCRRFDARAVMLAGGWVAAALLALHGAVRSEGLLYALRAATGLASAFSFVAGGLLAALLALEVPRRGALVIGIYYGGVGLGIVASALLVPPFTARGASGWATAWLALAAAAALGSALTARGTRGQHGAAPPGAERTPFAWRAFAPALLSYGLFGLGYIGYMTFIVTLLREQGLASGAITLLYVLLGCGVVASPWLWAGLLQRHRSGLPLALLNALLALATLLPLLAAHGLSVFVSGLLFGSVFLSLVASTTALVRHNCDSSAWPSGIAAFTVVFAAGQIAGPSLVGWIADGPGGLPRGFMLSAALLALAALLAAAQRPLSAAPHPA